MLSKITLAIAAFAATATSAPLAKRQTVVDQYNFYTGDGSTEQGWPADTQWGSYDALWAENYFTLQNSCVWNQFSDINNSEREIADLNTAIQQVSGETGVDARFILTIVMQESVGCVRAPETDNGVRNPGLMQSHNGSGTCQNVADCPYDMILQMIRDGTAGTIHGDGLTQLLTRTRSELAGQGGGEARRYYAAARLYNSGSVDYSNLNNGFTSTACYSTDVANRFTGWGRAPSSCPFREQ